MSSVIVPVYNDARPIGGGPCRGATPTGKGFLERVAVQIDPLLRLIMTRQHESAFRSD